MGFDNGSGFANGGGNGGASAAVVDIQQFLVGAGGNNPTGGTSLFTPTPASLQGSNCVICVNGIGFLQNGVQVSFTTSGGFITSITLLTGLLFNDGELYTVIAYIS